MGELRKLLADKDAALETLKQKTRLFVETMRSENALLEQQLASERARHADGRGGLNATTPVGTPSETSVSGADELEQLKSENKRLETEIATSKASIETLKFKTKAFVERLKAEAAEVADNAAKKAALDQAVLEQNVSSLREEVAAISEVFVDNLCVCFKLR